MRRTFIYTGRLRSRRQRTLCSLQARPHGPFFRTFFLLRVQYHLGTRVFPSIR